MLHLVANIILLQNGEKRSIVTERDLEQLHRHQ